MTTADIINGLKHTADDHPCCRATMEEAISKLELLKNQVNSWRPTLRLLQNFRRQRYVGGTLFRGSMRRSHSAFWSNDQLTHPERTTK